MDRRCHGSFVEYSVKATHRSIQLRNLCKKGNVFDTTEVSVQTETALTASVEVQTDLTIHPDCHKLDAAIQSDLTIQPDCCKVDAAIQCSVEENKENLPPQDSSVEYIMYEGNKDEKFYPIIEKHKGVFKNVSG